MKLTREEILQKYGILEDISVALEELARKWEMKGVLVENIDIKLDGVTELPRTQFEQELAEALRIVHKEEMNLAINLNRVDKAIWDKVFEQHLTDLLKRGERVSTFTSLMTEDEFVKALIEVKDGEVIVIHEIKYGAPLRDIVYKVLDDLRTSGKQVRSIITLGRMKSEEKFRIY